MMNSFREGPRCLPSAQKKILPTMTQKIHIKISGENGEEEREDSEDPDVKMDQHRIRVSKGSQQLISEHMYKLQTSTIH